MCKRQARQRGIDLRRDHKSAIQVKVARPLRGDRRILRTAESAEIQQAALTFRELLRAEAFFQRALDLGLECRLDLAQILWRKDRASPPFGMCFDAAPADLAADVIRQPLGVANALPQARAAAAAEQMVRHHQRGIVGVVVR